MEVTLATKPEENGIIDPLKSPKPAGELLRETPPRARYQGSLARNVASRVHEWSGKLTVALQIREQIIFYRN